MNKILIGLILVVVLALSACSVSNYLPSANNSTSTGTSISGDVVLNDSFNLADNTTNGVGENATQDNLSEEKSNDGVLTTFTAVEGDLISLKDLYAVDPDGDSVSYSYEKPFNGIGLWQTNEGDAGKYLTTIVATDGILSTSEQVQIIVKPSNKPPVIDCNSEFNFSEGDFIQLPCVIYDKEGDKVSYTVSGFMSDLSYQTTYDDAGKHKIVISATDGNKVSTKEITINIANVDRAPVLATASLAPINATELDTVKLNVDVSDPDGDSLEITYPEMFDENGVWTPQKGDAGSYDLNVTVSDGTKEITLPFHMDIAKVNLPPVFKKIGTLTYNEGDFISLPVNITDDDEVIVYYSGWMNGRTYQTTYDDAGEHDVTILASDGLHEVSQVVHIIVNNIDRPPVFVDDE